MAAMPDPQALSYICELARAHLDSSKWYAQPYRMGIAPEPPSDQWYRSMGSLVGFLFLGDLTYPYVRLLLGALNSFMAIQVASEMAMRVCARCLLNGSTGYTESWSFFITCPSEGAQARGLTNTGIVSYVGRPKQGPG
jgi:hypothetical protein